MNYWKAPLIAVALILLIVATTGTGAVSIAHIGTIPIVHAAETQTESATRHIALSPSEVNQLANFEVTILGSHFEAAETLMLMTDAGFSGTPACANNSVDGQAVTTDAAGNFAIVGHFMNCITNTISVVANDHGHLYRTILDID